MRKNQANIKKINTNKKKKFLYFDWIIFGFFVLSIFSNIVLFGTHPKLMNPVSILLFQLWQLIFVIYFTFRITMFSLTDKTIEKQKTIAKTAIRQIRSTQSMTENLIGIVDSKTDCFKNDKMIDTLKEINNHLNSLIINITSSESSFKDILGEEFKEETLLWTKIEENFNLLNEKLIQEKKSRKKEEKEGKARQSELQNEIDELRVRISTDISSLPITGPSGPSGPYGASSPSGYQSILSKDDLAKLRATPLMTLMGEGISIEEKEQKEDKKS